MTAGLAIASAVSTVLLIGVLAAANLAIRHKQEQILEALRRERLVRSELALTNERLAAQKRQTEEALQRKTVALEERNDDLLRQRQASYFQRVALADAEHRAGREDRARQLLDACPVDLRGWESRILKNSLTSQPGASSSAIPVKSGTPCSAPTAGLWPRPASITPSGSWTWRRESSSTRCLAMRPGFTVSASTGTGLAWYRPVRTGHRSSGTSRTGGCSTSSAVTRTTFDAPCSVRTGT